jgi:hypothetical protein
MLGYLNRLSHRITKRKFEHDDELQANVLKTAAALHELTVQLHYLSCRMGLHDERKSQSAVTSDELR